MVMLVEPPETVNVYQPSLKTVPQLLAGPLVEVFVIVAERHATLLTVIDVAVAQFIPCPKALTTLNIVITATSSDFVSILIF